MNREEAKELLPIIQAFAEGETIQVKMPSDNGWREVSDPSFTSLPQFYRIKPEPREFYLNLYTCQISKSGCDLTYIKNPDEIIKVREVIE